MSETRETRLFMISPDSKITPDQLVRTVNAMGKDVTVKETCYGCLVEGHRDAVRDVLSSVRSQHPNEIFSKVRAYPAGDPRRCRAQHGTRPGFAQLEAEWATLPLIQCALDSEDRGEKYTVPEETEQIPMEKFKSICEECR
jgi:putative methanogenesis marker protein 6